MKITNSILKELGFKKDSNGISWRKEGFGQLGVSTLRKMTLADLVQTLSDRAKRDGEIDTRVAIRKALGF